MVAAGVLTHTPSQASNTAAYLQGQLDGPVARIGCVAEWPDDGTGTVALVLPSSTWATGALTPAGVHVTVKGDGTCAFGRYVSGSQLDQQSALISPLVGGRHTIEVVLNFEAEQIAVYVDGAVALTVDNATAFTQIADLAVWELFETNGTSDVPATLLSVWAATESRVPALGPVSGPRSAMLPAAYKVVNPGSTTTYAIGSSYASLGGDMDMSITMPESGAMLVSLDCYLQNATTTVYVRAKVGSTTSVAQRVNPAAAFTGHLHTETVVTGTPGQTYTLEWQFSSASGSPTVAAGSSSGAAFIKAVPVGV